MLHNPNDKTSIVGNYILTTSEDSKGNLWLGTWGDGITILSPERKVIRHIKKDVNGNTGLSSNNVWAILEAKDKRIWIGTHGGGINIYDPKTNTFSYIRKDIKDPNSIKDNEISKLLEDSQGRIWIGTFNGGLSCYLPESNTLQHFLHHPGKNSISNNSINAILENKDNQIVIGTATGINLLDPNTNKFTHLTSKSQSSSETITSILEDEKGNLWVSTTKGIFQVDYKSKSFTYFSTADGLQGDIFKPAACKTRNGAMYFGGTNGFNEFCPEVVSEGASVSPIYLTRFLIFNKEVSLASAREPHSPLEKDISVTKEIIVPYNQSMLTFEFASLDFTFKQSLQYAYKLDGFDKDWNLIGTNRSATYTNLDPGKYLFKVKTIDSNGKWSVKTGTVRLVVTPPFWMTWWFLVLATFSIIGVAFAFYRSRVKAMHTHKVELEKQVYERTAQVMLQKGELQVQAENLKGLNEELQKQKTYEQQVREEAEQAREEAEKARNEAEKANQAKSIFLAIMSHKIRTPLNGVIGMTSLPAETQLEPEQQNFTQIIRRYCQNLLSVTNDILDFTKIESGKMEL